MKTFLASSLLFLVSLSLKAQFYFEDFETTAELENTMADYLEQKVAGFAAVGYDASGARNRDFQETHYINAAEKSWRKIVRNGFNISRQGYRFNNDGMLISIADSSNGIYTLTRYEYAADQLVSVSIVTSDTSNEFNRTEKRVYQYNAANLPTGLIRVIDDRDTIRYKLVADEKSRIVEERPDRPGSNASNDFVYYYYNDNDQLTDLVRYDKFLKKLMPERMFEYDANGRIIQMITMLSSRSGDFLTWRYAFNAEGLKTREALFNRQREQTGRIDYSYTFSR